MGHRTHPLSQAIIQPDGCLQVSSDNRFTLEALQVGGQQSFDILPPATTTFNWHSGNRMRKMHLGLRNNIVGSLGNHTITAMYRRRSRQHGFSLIELLVVISIIAVLSSMLLSGVALVRTAARGVACSGNLRQLGMCIQAYAGDNNGLLPFRQAVISENGSPTFKEWSIHLLVEYARERSDTLGWGTGTGEDTSRSAGIYRCAAASTLTTGGMSDFGLSRYVFPDNTNGWNMAMGWWNPVVSRVSNRAYIMADTWDPSLSTKSGMLTDTTVHYRHGAAANFLFIDGHIERLRREAVPEAGSDMMLVASSPDKWVPRGPVPWGNDR